MYWIKYEIPKSHLNREEHFQTIEVSHPEKFIDKIAIEVGFVGFCAACFPAARTRRKDSFSCVPKRRCAP